MDFGTFVAFTPQYAQFSNLFHKKKIGSYPQFGFLLYNTKWFTIYIKWEKVGKNKIMLIGEYIHTIDTKNRVSLPFKFRKELGRKIIITPGLDQCLFIFTTNEWKKVSKRLSDSDSDLSFLKRDKRSFNRFMFGRAAEVEVDSIGRILVPDFLKARIGLKEKVAIIGVEDRVEIWSEDAWIKYRDKAEREADELAEKLSESSK